MTPYVLADDLSGALEVGAAFRACGWRVVLPLRPDGPPEGALRILSTETRNCTAAQAAKEVRRVVAAEQARGGHLLFKKIDSTLRGPLGGELGLLRELLKPRVTLLCPANPMAGRTIRSGVLRVHGVPLAATDFRHDSYWPAESSSVAEILHGQGIDNVASLELGDVRRGAPQAAEKIRHAATGGPVVVVCNAELHSDLTVIAAAARIAEVELLVGSGAFAEAVGHLGPVDRARQSEIVPPRFRSLLILCGSRHSTSHRQIDMLDKKRIGKIFELQAGQFDPTVFAVTVRDALDRHGVVAVRFEAPASPNPELAGVVVRDLGTLAHALDADARETDLYVLTGGETARVVCEALNGQELEILAEVERGVVLAALRRPTGKHQFIVSKPGGFGGETLLANLAETVK